MSGRVAGKVAVVTDAGSGIRRASALALAREGARLVVTDVNACAGEQVAALICQGAGNVLFVRTDVSRNEEVCAMAVAANAQFGRIDIPHSNAGCPPPPEGDRAGRGGLGPLPGSESEGCLLVLEVRYPTHARARRQHYPDRFGDRHCRPMKSGGVQCDRGRDRHPDEEHGTRLREP